MTSSASCLLSRATDWVFKGEGNANVVYEYIGAHAHLAGKVLKVRKKLSDPCNGADGWLEYAAWEPVLGQGQVDPMSREMAYTQHCLVPLFGAEHVPEQEPIQLALEFLQQLSAGTGPCAARAADPSSPVAVLMPDVTLFADPCPVGASMECSNAAEHTTSILPSNRGAAAAEADRSHQDSCGSAASPPCSFVQRPSRGGQAGPTPVDGGNDGSDGSGGGGGTWAAEAGGASLQGQGVGASAAGPTLCVELKPKCGYVGSCETVHLDNRIKHSKSRYHLHQLLKLSEGRVEVPSSYEPLDLFSGDPERMLCALRALFAHPQNNLKLFWGGRRAGVQQGVRAWAAASGSNAGCCGSYGREEDGVTAETAEEGAAQEDLFSLLVQILNLEGVLPRLLEAQQQCEYDIEGVYALYCHLRGSAAGLACSSGPHTPARQRSSTAHPAACDVHGTVEPERSLQADAAGASRSEDAVSLPTSRLPTTAAQGSSSGSNHAALQQLLSLPLPEAYAVLRQYVVAATAKDCALMIALQRLPSGGAAAQLAERGNKVVCHAGSGAWYRYRVAFVDLDMKPLTKILQHYALDQRIVQAARRHHEGCA